MTQAKEPIAKSPSGRVKRTPIGARNRLTVDNMDPNYSYRIVTDRDDRLQQFKEAGWEPVPKSQATIGDKRLDVASAEGSAAAIGLGKGDKGVLMRIDKDLYEEDQRAKQAQIDQMEQSMVQNASNGMYGKIEITR